MNKVIVSVTVALGLTACATNEFDAQIAMQKRWINTWRVV